LAGYFDLAVRPEYRRRGLAARAVRAAADWARQHGAEWLFCQVAVTNTASLALNTALGLREAYRYTYWVRPQDGLPTLRFS
jgi:ribosomal protein S18 acetylase RimI-like enzyme